MQLRIFLSVALFTTIVSFPVQAQDKWKKLKTRHFVIYFQNAPMNFIKEVDKAAEDDYTDISSAMGVRRMKTWTFDDRAVIYIYDDDEHYAASARQASWSHGVASPKGKVIRSFPSAHGFFDSILPHEMTHIIFRELIGYEARVPLWLEEGVAMYYETGQRFGADKAVRKTIDDTFVPLDQLSNMFLTSGDSQEKVELFYQESASAVNFLIEQLGSHKFRLFCRKLEEGNSFGQAIAAIYTRQKNLDGLNKAWVDFLQDR